MLVDLTLLCGMTRLDMAAEEGGALSRAESNAVEVVLKLENKHFLNNLFNA
jgi:hypothetical protein